MLTWAHIIIMYSTGGMIGYCIRLIGVISTCRITHVWVTFIFNTSFKNWNDVCVRIGHNGLFWTENIMILRCIVNKSK